MRKMKFVVNRSCLPFSKVALFLVSSMLVATHNVSGQPWDLATDFSLTNNPVTVGGGAQWSWGVIDAADNFAAMDVLNPSQAVIGGNPAWELPCCTNGVPLISNNGPPSLGAAVGGHEPSGIDGIGLAYQWTSPIAGPVHIDASAFRLVQTAHSEANPRAQGYEVRHNNEVIADGGIFDRPLGNVDTNQMPIYLANVEVAVNDTLTLVTRMLPFQTQDFAAVNMTITPGVGVVKPDYTTTAAHPFYADFGGAEGGTRPDSASPVYGDFGEWIFYNDGDSQGSPTLAKTNGGGAEINTFGVGPGWAPPDGGVPNYTRTGGGPFAAAFSDPGIEGHGPQKVDWTTPAAVDLGAVLLNGFVEKQLGNPERQVQMRIYKNDFDGTGTPIVNLESDFTTPDVLVTVSDLLVPVEPGDVLTIFVDGNGSQNTSGGTSDFSNWNISLEETQYAPYSWQLDASADWHGTDSWPVGQIPGVGNVATFGPKITVPRLVYTETDISVDAIVFNNLSSYTIAATSNASVNIAASTTNLGAVTVSAGSHQFQAPVNFNSDATLQVANGSTLTFNNAVNLSGQTLTKAGEGGVEINNALNTGGGTVVGLAGTISGSGSVGGDLQNSGGTVAPGNSPGILTVNGNYTQGTDGTLAIEVAGTGAGTGHDQLDVTETATLDGTLDIQTDAGFTPNVGASPGVNGDQFVIVTASSVAGNFGTVNGRHVGSGLFYEVGYNTTNVTLSAFQALEGDANGDKRIDITDFNVLSSNFDPTGQNANDWTNADFNADGNVDITDFNSLSSNFAPSGYGDGPGQIPEPATMVLLVLGGCVTMLSVIRRR